MSSETKRTITLASRVSELAQIQTNLVLASLSEAFPETTFQTAFMSTAGDKNQSQALYLIGGKSLWTKELEHSLLDGEVDMLIHSFKDVPTSLPEGCEIAGTLEREDPVDSLVVSKNVSEDPKKGWKTLEEFEEGSVVGTRSDQRVTQLKRQFPKLKLLDVVSCLRPLYARSSRSSLLTSSEEICAFIRLDRVVILLEQMPRHITGTPAWPNSILRLLLTQLSSLQKRV